MRFHDQGATAGADNFSAFAQNNFHQLRFLIQLAGYLASARRSVDRV